MDSYHAFIYIHLNKDSSIIYIYKTAVSSFPLKVTTPLRLWLVSQSFNFSEGHNALTSVTGLSILQLLRRSRRPYVYDWSLNPLTSPKVTTSSRLWLVSQFSEGHTSVTGLSISPKVATRSRLWLDSQILFTTTLIKFLTVFTTFVTWSNLHWICIKFLMDDESQLPSCS